MFYLKSALSIIRMSIGIGLMETGIGLFAPMLTMRSTIVFHDRRKSLMKKLFIAVCCFLSVLKAEPIETFFGAIDVEEPVLLKLIKSPAMQRLKGIHQYGVAYYTTHREEYNRFNHSMGVFAVLRKNRASLEEQISGLLHDISHTVFSHVGDWVFGKEYQEDDYQSTIYKLYLSHSGIEEILLRHGYNVNGVLPKAKLLSCLSSRCPIYAPIGSIEQYPRCLLPGLFDKKRGA